MSIEISPSFDESFEKFDDFDMALELYSDQQPLWENMPGLVAFTRGIVPRALSLNEETGVFHEEPNVIGVINQLRHIPRMIAAIEDTPLSSLGDDPSDEQLQEFLAERFQKDILKRAFQDLPTELVYRLTCPDFNKVSLFRTFTDDMIDANFRPEFTDEVLNWLHLELHHPSSRENNAVFDLYAMDGLGEDESNDDDSEDESEEEQVVDPDKLVADGPERKAMAAILRRCPLPKDTPVYRQALHFTDKFVAANYELDDMDTDVITALPLIEELGKLPNEAIDEIDRNSQRMLRDENGTAEEAAAWEKFIGQVRKLDSTGPEWKQLLILIRGIEDMNKKSIAMNEEIQKAGGHLLQMDMNIEIRKPVKQTESVPADSAADQQAAEEAVDAMLKMIRGER